MSAATSPRIIDTHVHFYDPRRPQGVPWPPKGDELLFRPVLPPDYASLVRPLGVSGTIVVEASAWLEDNQWVLDLARDHRIIVGVSGHLQPENFRQNLQRFSRNPLFLGIRRSGASLARDVSALDDLRMLAGAGLTLDAIGPAAMLETLLRLSDKVPELRISINHMPVEPAGWKSSDAAGSALRQLAARPQIFAKVSGVLQRAHPAVSTSAVAYTDALDEVRGLFGPDRIMYGSNWPVSNRLAPYATILDVVRTWMARRGTEEAEKFFWRNSQACYRWRRPALVP